MLRQLQELGAAKSAIMTDDDLTEDEKAEKVKRPVYFFVKTICNGSFSEFLGHPCDPHYIEAIKKI